MSEAWTPIECSDAFEVVNKKRLEKAWDDEYKTRPSWGWSKEELKKWDLEHEKNPERKSK